MKPNNCIYYSDRDDLSFNTAEHVFPAGLGGIMTLPKGFVSDEFNNDISKVELRFMRESLIALPRQILGPGKRGKSGIKHATKSEVHLIENLLVPGSFSLGYIQLGKPFELPQIKIDHETGRLLCSIPKGDMEEDAQQVLVANLRKYVDHQVRYTEDERLGNNELILGFGKVIHVFKSAGNPFQLNQAFASSLEQAILNIASVPEHQRFHIKTSQDAVLGDDFYRICAKTAFNALAILKGKDLVLCNEFDAIRRYIAFGGDESPVIFRSVLGKMIKFPADSHRVILNSADNRLFANVSFYNGLETQVLLSENFLGNISAEGFICDWKNQQEYSLKEYFAREAAGLV